MPRSTPDQPAHQARSARRPTCFGGSLPDQAGDLVTSNRAREVPPLAEVAPEVGQQAAGGLVGDALGDSPQSERVWPCR